MSRQLTPMTSSTLVPRPFGEPGQVVADLRLRIRPSLRATSAPAGGDARLVDCSDSGFRHVQACADDDGLVSRQLASTISVTLATAALGDVAQVVARLHLIR